MDNLYLKINIFRIYRGTCPGNPTETNKKKERVPRQRIFGSLPRQEPWNIKYLSALPSLKY